MSTLVDEMHAEGATDVSAIMINNPRAFGYGSALGALNVPLPALQDTFQVIGGAYMPAIGSLLHCLQNDELLLVDPQGRVHFKVTASPEGYDLTLAGPREVIKTWVRSLAPSAAQLP
jgi:hypothetical protein